MSYRVAFQPELDLIVVVFEGEIPYQEEAAALLAVVNDPRMRQDAKFLIDKSRAKMTVAPEHVPQHLQLMLAHLEKFGQPTIANVVAEDYDFGMTRMLELSAEEQIDHQFMVFRSVDEACQWLGVDPDLIEWP